MRILISEQNRFERRRLATELSARGHDVVEATSRESLLDEALATPADLILVDLNASTSVPAALVTAVRNLGAVPHIYIIGLLDPVDPKVIAAAWSAGVDDLMRKGAPLEEFRGRVDAPRRIAEWSKRARSRSTDFSQPFALESLRCWRTIDTIVTKEIAEMLGDTSFRPGTYDASPAYTAEIPLSLPAEGLELRLAVGIDLESAQILADRLFAEAVSEGTLADTLRELANNAGGAFKRAALTEGPVFTLGLPVNKAALVPNDGDRCWSVAWGQLRLSFRVTRINAAPRHLAATNLRPGMVLGQDIRNSGGVLLLSAGSALTDRTVERIVDIMGGGTLVLASDPTARASDATTTVAA